MLFGGKKCVAVSFTRTNAKLFAGKFCLCQILYFTLFNKVLFK